MYFQSISLSENLQKLRVETFDRETHENVTEEEN